MPRPGAALVALILPKTNFICPSSNVGRQASSLKTVPKSLKPVPVGVNAPNWRPSCVGGIFDP